MKKFFIIQSLIFSMSTFGQSAENLTKNHNLQNTSTDCNLVDSITWSHLKQGFAKNNSACHCRYSLDSNSTFKLYSSDCLIEFDIDNGLWEIRNKNTLVLKSNNDTIVVQLLKVSESLFFIPPNEIDILQKDLRVVLAKSNNSASSKYFSRKLLILLGNKYYSMLTQN